MDLRLQEKSVSGTEPLTEPTWAVGIDEALYCSRVLHLPHGVSEEAEESELQRQLDELGHVQAHTHDSQTADTLTALPSPVPVDGLTSSFSTSTFTSDSTTRAARVCSSPDSVASSYVPPSATNQNATGADPSIPYSASSPVLSVGAKRRSAGLGLGFLKMATFSTFKKRKSISSWSPTAPSFNSDCTKTLDSDRASQQSAQKSMGSFESGKSSSWANAVSAPALSYERQTPLDGEALQRSLECREMQELSERQLAEHDRFVDFQHTLLSHLGARCEEAKAARRKLQQAAVEEVQHKMDVAVDDLEMRHLEEEVKLQREHELEKQRAMVRLRHMEAYCHSPTRPQTRHDAGGLARASTDGVLPERRVTEKDYHSLAQQYRERDSMASLHASKVNVLRGKQTKAVERLVRRGMDEIRRLEDELERELEAIDKKYASQENGMHLDLASKRARLEARWRMQALITRTQVERRTGLKHAALPDVSLAQEV